MGENNNSGQIKVRQLGFHYYNDADHFDDPSLDYWLPKLQKAGTRWLVLNVPYGFEIPTNFINRLKSARIEPVLLIDQPLSNTPSIELFTQRIAYYRGIGIHMVQFFNWPNIQSSWSAEDWQKKNLVARFMKKFAEYAAVCISQSIIPVFPTLVPGGDYWDLAFLRTAMQIMKKDMADTIMPNIVFSACAALNQHPLNWGQGGPSQYLPVSAYHEESVDHRGFYAFEWYQAIIKEELGRTVPMILFQAGQWSQDAGFFDFVTKESKQSYLRIINMLQEVRLNGRMEIPDYIISCNLYKLPSSQALSITALKNQTAPAISSEISDEEKKSVGTDFLHLILIFCKKMGSGGFLNVKNFIRDFGTNFVLIIKTVMRIFGKGDSISDYFLIPELSSLFTEEQLGVIRQYVKIRKCRSGSELNEALASKNVILMNDPALYPPYVINQLHDNNCTIETISLKNRGN